MNKCIYCKKFIQFRFVAIVVLLLLPLMVAAQTKKVTGIITDETGEAITGALVKIPQTTLGTMTNVNGQYAIELPQGKNQLEFSFLGYEKQIIEVNSRDQINVRLQPTSFDIDEVVVIGYGTQKKGDLTGSISSVSSKDFNTGLISSPEQLINGKVSGVQIMSNSGSPTSGSTIRIRGGASLNASNDPLIVLDGVPLEIGGISGNSGNFLALINPSDIESMTILKDASSTAIYGSRASNGVLIITTKKGSGDRLKVNFTTTNSVQTRTKLTDMLSREEFINIVNSEGSDTQKALLGSSATNWNDEIYQTAFGTDNNLSLSGRLAKNVPVRVSLGYYNQDGLVRTDNAERITGSFSLSPSFFQDHLKLNVNAKASHNNNRFANSSTIWNAATWNPTLPVYSGNDTFGGYTEALDNAGQLVTGGTINPLGALKQYKSTSRVSRLIGNFDLDYKMHFLPELKFHTTLGYDYAKGQGRIYVPAEAAQYKTSNGRDYKYGPQKNTNRLLTTYFNYNKFIDSWKSSLDATVGYDYQYWKSTSPLYSELNTLGEAQSTTAASDQRHVLLSYYSRLNYTFDSRYMLTATIRRDGTSRFSKENRWGTFPSLALAWRLSEEAFLKDNKVLSNLKLRASYGVTGQQEGIGNYNYLPVYTYSQDGAQAQFGNQWYYTYRPEAYVENLKWETTSSWNFGLDLGFLKERLSGSVDFYTRKTKDLLATVASPAGTNFDKNILTNVGNVDSKGIEFTLSASPIQSKDWNWDVSFNMTWQKMKVKNLSLVEGGATTNLSAGAWIDGQNVQVLSEGYAPYMFYVYKQLYDTETGKPIEGAYADLNDDGEINSGDLYHYKSPAPDFIFGFSTSLNYKKWMLSTSLRASVGNYVYNGMAMNTGAMGTMSYNSYQLNNLHRSYLTTGFKSRQHLSDYYVENGSFLKMDNLSLSYNFGRVCRWFSLNASVLMQNVFCITKYSGVDPEIPSGMDASFYPRPRTYSINLGFEF
ncbi:SusC/RagA family TonB-linked outer membrane protein [Dysgonomonas mossii]|uniref:SusC/RagA family TonB-linked outer membrane protein n=1 Tax=Dysgonomonas mossii TaxID=163665 RepID=UPI0009260AC0|nr:TonB-dependent receptor [Dysgonomonas mossii]OJX56539.1 MAG: SusC/RagA family protein [Dysgonomonas sp. 37-18]